MKDSTIYFGMVTVFVPFVVGIAMYVSGGFQMPQGNFGSMEHGGQTSAAEGSDG